MSVTYSPSTKAETTADSLPLSAHETPGADTVTSSKLSPSCELVNGILASRPSRWRDTTWSVGPCDGLAKAFADAVMEAETAASAAAPTSTVERRFLDECDIVRKLRRRVARGLT